MRSFHSLESTLAAAMASPLPGLEAQLRMAPQPRVGWDPHTLPEGLRDGAALLLVYPRASQDARSHNAPGGSDQPPLKLRRSAEASAKAEDPPLQGRFVPHVLLTVRGSGLRSHTGQVSLPGGAVDPNESYESAALREASEEVGCIPGAVRVLGRLTPVHIPVSGFHLHPILGVVDDRPDFRAAEWEVARILEVPIDHLRDASTIKRQTQTRKLGDKTIEVEVPYFDIDGEKVWGATAMILAEFLALMPDA